MGTRQRRCFGAVHMRERPSADLRWSMRHLRNVKRTCRVPNSAGVSLVARRHIRTMPDGPTEAAGRPLAHACGPEGPPPAPLISKRPGRRARCERCARKLRKLPKLTRKLPKLTLSKLHRRSGPLGLNAASTLPVRRPRPTLFYLPLSYPYLDLARIVLASWTRARETVLVRRYGLFRNCVISGSKRLVAGIRAANSGGNE